MGRLRDAVLRSSLEIKALAEKYDCVEIKVFGSVARGEETPASDIDFLVEFGPSASILDLVNLERELSELLNCKVDVVSIGGLKPRDQHLLDEAVVL